MVIALLLLKLLTSASASAPRTDVVAEVRQMFTQVNLRRRRAGVPVLRLDGRLSALATQRANDMIRRSYFGHVTPEGRLPWDMMRAEGCAFHQAAENIAQADGEREAANALWKSAEHRRNALDADYHKIGIGIAINSDGSEIFVEDFTD